MKSELFCSRILQNDKWIPECGNNNDEDDTNVHTNIRTTTQISLFVSPLVVYHKIEERNSNQRTIFVAYYHELAGVPGRLYCNNNNKISKMVLFRYIQIDPNCYMFVDTDSIFPSFVFLNYLSNHVIYKRGLIFLLHNLSWDYTLYSTNSIKYYYPMFFR